jgi:4-amino-4-deoxy-L-arabinose transferase-like glycosyltransferase
MIDNGMKKVRSLMPSVGRRGLLFPEQTSGSSNNHIVLILLIFTLGLVLRLFTWQHTGIINSDGAIYINQARAIYYGLWDLVNTCSTARFPTVTTLCIAAAYPILGDWVTAGTFVSLFFGTITLVPLYLLARRFFDKDISAVIALVYALNPTLIDASVDIVRDSTAWFFLTLGLYLFTKDKKQSDPYLIMSSISFIIAAWTRVEFFIFIACSPIYILIDREEKRLRRASVFLLPAVVIFFTAIGSQLLLHPERINWYRLADIPQRASAFLSQYHEIRAQLAELTSHPKAGIPTEFFDKTRDILWFVGIGVILQNTLETYYYPFFLLYLMGLGTMGQRIRDDVRVLYFCLLVPAVILLLYCYLFVYWQMENRWLSLALFPSFIFLGCGLEQLISLLQSKFTVKRGAALLLICLLILAFGLPKNSKSRGEDKIIFKTLGEAIAGLEGNAKRIEILTVGISQRWVLFYANLHSPGAPCTDDYVEYKKLIGNDYGQFLKFVKSRGIQFLVWEEKNWPAGRFDFLTSPYERDFIPLGSWHHRDTGKITLFKVR